MRAGYLNPFIYRSHLWTCCLNVINISSRKHLIVEYLRRSSPPWSRVTRVGLIKPKTCTVLNNLTFENTLASEFLQLFGQLFIILFLNYHLNINNNKVILRFKKKTLRQQWNELASAEIMQQWNTINISPLAFLELISNNYNWKLS